MDGKRETASLKITAPVYSRRRFVGVFQDTGIARRNQQKLKWDKILWGLSPLNRKDYNPHNNDCQDRGNLYDNI